MTYACERDGNKCHFHAYVENSKTLNVDGRSEFCVTRVNAQYQTIVMNRLTQPWSISLCFISTNRKWRSVCRKTIFTE